VSGHGPEANQGSGQINMQDLTDRYFASVPGNPSASSSRPTGSEITDPIMHHRQKVARASVSLEDYRERLAIEAEASRRRAIAHG